MEILDLNLLAHLKISRYRPRYVTTYVMLVGQKIVFLIKNSHLMRIDCNTVNAQTLCRRLIRYITLMPERSQQVLTFTC